MFVVYHAVSVRLNSEKVNGNDLTVLTPVILNLTSTVIYPMPRKSEETVDYGSSFPQSLALLWSVRQWTEVEAQYHHLARMRKCENSLDSLKMTRNAEISAQNSTIHVNNL